MALSKTEKKAAAKAARLEQREKRREAAGEIMSARFRTAAGFGGAYVATQILPAFAPSVASKQATIDLLLAGAGGYFALTDDGEFGDFALGAALVGLLQTFDTISAKLQGWLKPAAA